ncbi:hypothetical protein WL42_26100 [Burkholderia ubonensis]|nr:hypothetical protein WL42_26100 [Burkholderia ubonensis]
MMQISDDIIRVEQRDQVLRQVTERIDPVFAFAQPDRTRLRDRERWTHDADIDIIEFMRANNRCDVARALEFGRSRTDHASVRKA